MKKRKSRNPKFNNYLCNMTVSVLTSDEVSVMVVMVVLVVVGVSGRKERA